MSDLFESLREAIDEACPPVSAVDAIERGDQLSAPATGRRSPNAGRHFLAVASLLLVALVGIGLVWRDGGSGPDAVRTGPDTHETTTTTPAVVDGRCAANPPAEFLPTSSLVFEQQVYQAPGTGGCGHMTLVAGADERVGWVSLDDIIKPDVLAPVYDDAAHQIAWWAGGLGWLDLDTVADPGFDLAAARAAADAAAQDVRSSEGSGARANGPAEPPAGWEPVDYDDMRLYVPPTWRVTTSGCHGRDQTVTLGSPPTGTSCPDPDPSAEWIWIAPSEAVAAESPGCTTGSQNWLPGCLVQDLDSGRQIQFVDGVPVALVHQQGGSDSTSDEIASTWRYQDQQRPEAQPDYQGESPLFIASDFAVAIAAGRCNDATALAAPGFEPPCVSSDPPIDAAVSEAGLTGWSGAVPTQSARVVTDPGQHVLELVLQVRWNPTAQRASWRVISATDTTPG